MNHLNEHIKEKIIKVQYVYDYKVYIEFDDGLAGVVDLEDHIWGDIFQPLKNKNYFSKCYLSEITGTISWEDKIDLAPEFLRELIQIYS